MCGIAGIYNGSGRPAEAAALARMTGLLRHRGPDDEGFFLDGAVGLGHRRLRIIDLENGRQPLFNEDGRVAVVFNGEIYNHEEVRAELEAKGHRFRTRCDTEAIVHAYEEYGEACPERLRGMFAFAVYDKRTGGLFLARDRAGEKPLYYAWDGETFLFASEVKPLLAARAARPEANLDALDFYVTVGYVPGERTFFRGVRKLPPGHSLALRGGELRVRKYWDLDGAPSALSFPEAQAAFEELFLDCVRMRLMSEVPLGAFLSGGLDSSAVVAAMSRLSSGPVKTFSVGYLDDPASSELDHARVVARRFKTDHREFILRSGDFFDSLDRLLEHAEEPVVESAAVALYQLSGLAREHVTVILSGEGGDEVLAGYPLHRLMPAVDRAHRVVRSLPAALRGWVAGGVKAHEKAAKYWDWAQAPLAERYHSISHDVTGSIKRRLYADGLCERLSGETGRYFRELFAALPGATDLRRMTYVDIKSWLPDDLLLKADKMTMAHALELRVPFLDHKLMEFCHALPDDYRLRGRQGKYLLKKVMEKYLPPGIVYRKKKGFPVPVAAWFRGPLWERTREVLLDRRARERGYFRPEYVAEVLRLHKEGKQDLSRRIFSLLALEMWHRKYVDRENESTRDGENGHNALRRSVSRSLRLGPPR
jgi:asparagine synthase (glutamine-hydrolysing)